MARIRKRIKKDGTPTYKVCIRKKNHPSITKTFDSLEKANAFEEVMEKSLDNPSNNVSYPLKVILIRYKLDYLPNKKDYKKEYVFINFWIENAGNILLNEINMNTLLPIIVQLKNTPNRFDRERTWDNVRKYWMHLGACLNWAVLQNIIPNNPLKGMGITHLIPKEQKKTSTSTIEGGDSKEIFLEELLKVVTIEDIKKTRGQYLSKSSINYFLDSKRNASLFTIERVCKSLGLELGFTFTKKDKEEK